MPTSNDLETAIDRIARKCHIAPEQLEDVYPCTSLQAALVAASLHQLGSYVARFVFDISRTPCSQDAVKTAFEDVYDQTPILRTRVVENGGQFLQVVTRDPLKWLTAEDLQNYLGIDRENMVVLGEPLARFGWISQPNGKIYMVWGLHHCQYDEWSFRLLVEDLNNALLHSGKRTGSPQRTPLSKFVKALSRIDSSASHSFWETQLCHVSECRTICPSAPDEDGPRTSDQLVRVYSLQLQQNKTYQPSTLAVAAWSLLTSRLSDSSSVLFGHVLSGRTSDLVGIQEICGPTLATVPWSVQLSPQETIKDFLEQLYDLRRQIPPFEQTGLDEYRKLMGTAAFGTLLSVRYSEAQSDEDNATDALQPEKPDARDLSHPCSVFLEIDIKGDDCTVKASYDERMIAVQLLEEVVDRLKVIMERFLSSLDSTLEEFKQVLDLPSSISLVKQSGSAHPKTVDEHASDRVQVDAKVMRKVQKLASQVAGLRDDSSVGAETSLMQLGVDSLKTVVLSNNLNKTFQVSVPFREIAGPERTLSSIGRSIERARKGADVKANSESSVPLLEKAAKFMKGIETGVSERHRLVKKLDGRTSILLTGSTGYLGIEILRQLAVSEYNIVLLVRCTNAVEGLERVNKSAETASWKAEEIESLKRAQIWPSDLSKEKLGLASDHWQLLTDPKSCSSPYHFKAIVHNGAKVDFLHTYADLEDANVRSAAILLEQHIKSSNEPNFVFVTGGRPCPLTPDDVEETAKSLAEANGYAQTKFVSEVLVDKTKALLKDAGQSAQMSIIHPGAVIGSHHTGVSNTDDYIWRYVAASLRMGCHVPAVPTRREWINLTPVDFVASTVVSQALRTPVSGQDSATPVQRYLVRMGLPVHQFWAVVREVLGQNNIFLKSVSEWEWLVEVEADLQRSGQANPLLALSQLLLQGQMKGIGGGPPAIHPKTGAGPDTLPTQAALRTNVQQLLSRGFLSAETSGEQLDGLFARSKA